MCVAAEEEAFDPGKDTREPVEDDMAGLNPWRRGGWRRLVEGEQIPLADGCSR